MTQFKTTHWSVVEDAQASGEQADAALAVLCETYWQPLHRHLLFRGYPDEDAKDIIQGFFLRLIEKRYLDSADAEKGRFRTFLLTCLERYLANEHRRENAKKRGGGLRRVDLDGGSLAPEGKRIPAPSSSPAEEYDRQWALALIARAIERAREREVRAGRSRLLSVLGEQLYLDSQSLDYLALAEELGMTPNALKVAAHRMRKRLHALIWEEVRMTVKSEDEAREELKYLLEILSR